MAAKYKDKTYFIHDFVLSCFIHDSECDAKLQENIELTEGRE